MEITLLVCRSEIGGGLPEVGKMTVFDYARMAAQAEKRILELFEGALRDGAANAIKKDLPDSAQRQGQESSG